MQDKTFELLEKMYGEFNKRFDKVETDINGLKNDINELKNDVLRIELNHGEKLKVLFDGHVQNTQQLGRIEGKINTISEKVDRHDIKIQVIEGGRK
jgi:hypothetical protein